MTNAGDIFEILKAEHADLRRLLEEVIEPTEGPAAGILDAKLLELRSALISHDRAEEAVFYEALKNVPNRTELAETKEEEHHMTEAILEDLIASREDWDAKLALLKNHMEGHIAEEETSVFAIMQSSISTEQSEQMARSFVQQKGAFLPMHSVSDQPGDATSTVVL